MDSQSKNDYTLMCASEEPLQYVADQNIHVAQQLYILSRDKILTYLMILYIARHHLDACDIPFRLTTSCDVKTMIYHFLNTVVTSKLLSIVFLTRLGNGVLSYVHCEGIS